jgi:ATP-dependent Clp protease protease subunit
MQYIKSDVAVVCMGMAASMGAFLLSGGAHGKRFALPNAEIMIHQPLIGGGLGGQQTDIMIHAKNLERTRDRLETIMAKNTGKTVEEIHNACERDNYLTAQEALDFGLIDQIVENR